MDATDTIAQPTHAPAYSLWQLVGYFLKLGTFGFGGPVALAGSMHRDLMEQRHIVWRTKKVPESVLVLGAAGRGLILSPLVGRVP